MNVVEVTNQVSFQNPDDEALPITRCVCGEHFDPWEFVISIDGYHAYSCPKCGRKLFFRNIVHVFEVQE